VGFPLVHVNLTVALAGLIVGFTVGLTGMGGGALMTPILVLLFKIQPLAAVSSDLVAALVMKPVGGAVHARRGTVNFSLVRWLCLGSVPAAFAGVFVLRALGGDHVQNALKIILGIALIVASTSIVVKSYLQGHAAERMRRHGDAHRAFQIRALPTFLIGAAGGLIVGMTSVGSGSLIIVALLLLYPMLSSRELVGTDLIQAIPLVAAAALGHVLYGDFQLGLTASILIGSLPGVYLGARLSSRAPDGLIRPALVFVLVASGLRLVGMQTSTVGMVLLVLVLVGLPLWGAIDAARKHDDRWEEAGQSRTRWVRLQGLGAVVGVGFVASVVYFAKVRPQLLPGASVPVREAA
jgi:uncharacterized membrane protein YfcA